MSNPSNGQIYEAINNLRLELKSDIAGVDKKVNDLRVKQAISNTKLAGILSSTSIFVSAVITVVVDKMVRKG